MSDDRRPFTAQFDEVDRDGRRHTVHPEPRERNPDGSIPYALLRDDYPCFHSVEDDHGITTYVRYF